MDGDGSAAPTRPASIRDVARAAGVSTTTVSHALSGRRPVAAETARRIRALVPDLGYVPYAAAQGQLRQRAAMLGLVVPDIGNRFFAEVAIGVESLANEEGYGVVVGVSQSDPHRERRFYGQLRSGHLDGLIYIPGLAGRDEVLQDVAAKHPVVVVDELVETVTNRPAVVSDHLQGGRLAGEHLHALGHRRCAVLTGPPGLLSTEERTAGFRSVMPDAVVLRGDYTEGAGRTLARVLTTYHPGVTAVFAGNDLLAFGALEAFRAAGRSVPHDVSLVGFDDVDFAVRITPALTTVRQRPVDLGRRAARMMLDHLLRGVPLGPARVALPVELVLRDSTAAPPAA